MQNAALFIELSWLAKYPPPVELVFQTTPLYSHLFLWETVFEANHPSLKFALSCSVSEPCKRLANLNRLLVLYCWHLWKGQIEKNPGLVSYTMFCGKISRIVDGTYEKKPGKGKTVHMCFSEVLRGYISRRLLNWYGCVDDDSDGSKRWIYSSLSVK